MIDIAETLLPLPDSPTSATVRFTGTSKETPFTASKGSVLRSTRKRMRRSRIAAVPGLRLSIHLALCSRKLMRERR
jgi:hypothetical protein